MQGKRRTKVGRVISDRMDKTVVVSVERLRRHPIYKRVVRLSSKFKAHDEQNAARIGDTVRIEETRPLSREKRWAVVEILSHDLAAAAAVRPDEQLADEPLPPDGAGEASADEAAEPMGAES